MLVRSILSFAMMAIAAVSNAPTSYAQIGSPTQFVEEPPQIGLVDPQFDARAMFDLSPRELRPEVVVDLDIKLLNSKIWNPNSGQFDNVLLRAYQSPSHPASPDKPYVAPTLVARPGNTVRINLRNLLPEEQGCPGHVGDINEPHCFNTTNLHSHGLWINPEGISDNVLRTLAPNKSFTYEYEYNIPADHPAGTFWYHPHVHGSTAIQVASGLAGALIVKGDRLPRSDAAGDIDVLLRRDNAEIPDHVFMLQQIQYLCRDPNISNLPNTKTNADGTWRCDESDVGMLDGYDAFQDPDGPNPPGFPLWDTSGRFTTVNGATAAPLKQIAVAGQPERWRFIHGGVADTIRVSIRKKTAQGDARIFADAKAADQQALIDRECAPQDAAVPQFEIATDGLTRHAVLERSQTFLQPGYRSDLLVVFPEAGTYCVIDEEVPGAASAAQNQPSPRRLLFTVEVSPGAGAEAFDPRTEIKSMMLDAASRIPVDVGTRHKVMADLNNGLNISSFAPHRSLAHEMNVGKQSLYFSMNAAAPPPATPGPGIGTTATNARRFDPRDFSRTLVIGGIDEWTLNSLQFGHPFHIHVNPFEIISVTQGGTDLTSDRASQFYGMKGVWKDTIFVPQGVEIKMRTHYRRHIGTFVLHCHILYHEDRGMMEMVRIADRDANGMALSSSHGHVHADPEPAEATLEMKQVPASPNDRGNTTQPPR